MQIKTSINGQERILEALPNEFLAETLRRYGYLSVKQGCETGSCGLCTVWLDGRPTLSCCTLTVRVAQREITTIEGLQERGGSIRPLHGGMRERNSVDSALLA